MLMTPIIYTSDNENNYDNEALQNVIKEYSQLDAILSNSNTEPINFQIMYYFNIWYWQKFLVQDYYVPLDSTNSTTTART